MNVSPKYFALVVRGPTATRIGDLLHSSRYRDAVDRGLGMLFRGTDACTVVRKVLDELEHFAMEQQIPQPKIYDRENMGPLQAFGAIAMDQHENCCVMHRKHPRIMADRELVENHGLVEGPEGCVSIAGPHEIAQKYAELIGRSPLPDVLCHQIYHNARTVFGGILMARGLVGIATGNRLMPWAYGAKGQGTAYGHAATECNEFHRPR